MPRQNPWKHLRNTSHACPDEGLCTACLCLDYLSAKEVNWKPRTVDLALLHLTYFAGACPVLPRVPEPIERFLGSLRIRGRNSRRRGQRVSQCYRANIGKTLGQLYKWAVKREKLDIDVWAKVEAPRRPQSEPYWLEEEDLEVLLLHPGHPPRDRALLFLLGDSGMRVAEAASITVSNLSDDRAIVFGKTGMRIVPLRSEVVEMVRACIPSHAKPGDSVWWGKRGPMTGSGLTYVVRNAFARAGFVGAKMSPHRMRHTFATLWTGADSDCMDVGGWRDYKTFRVYKTLRIKRLVAAQAEHSPLARLFKQPDRPFTAADARRLSTAIAR